LTSQPDQVASTCRRSRRAISNHIRDGTSSEIKEDKLSEPSVEAPGHMMDNVTLTPFTPLVRGSTNTLSVSVNTFMEQFADKMYFVPDYQRDSSQWKLGEEVSIY
jgi:hypothetical protein